MSDVDDRYANDRCPDCRRPRATPAEWEAFRGNDCNDPHCAWGGDCCWYEVPCCIPDANVLNLVVRARKIRGRRSWADVPHLHAVTA
ncbi:hypothetical protein [Actinoplanes sp. NPDC051494]|uniref:hypothetical protein n=1 Tax=Actinoplanes sp. NPDC051494 TaxID=3363907 RepID=UPI00379E949A